jgi:hypothetical protein
MMPITPTLALLLTAAAAAAALVAAATLRRAPTTARDQFFAHLAMLGGLGIVLQPQGIGWRNAQDLPAITTLPTGLVVVAAVLLLVAVLPLLFRRQPPRLSSDSLGQRSLLLAAALVVAGLLVFTWWRRGLDGGITAAAVIVGALLCHFGVEKAVDGRPGRAALFALGLPMAAMTLTISWNQLGQFDAIAALGAVWLGAALGAQASRGTAPWSVLPVGLMALVLGVTAMGVSYGSDEATWAIAARPAAAALIALAPWPWAVTRSRGGRWTYLGPVLSALCLAAAAGLAMAAYLIPGGGSSSSGSSYY